MTKIFISGSRKIKELNQDIINRLDNIMQNNEMVLIGDADGVDENVQKYLYEKNYENVIIYCANECINVIGKWEIRHIKIDRIEKDLQYYAIRDLVMAKESDYAIAIWTGKSRGTLNNVLNMLKYNKPMMVYFNPEKKYYELKDFQSLSELLKKCDEKYLRIFENEFGISKIINEYIT